jgi:hypothetical protein
MIVCAVTGRHDALAQRGTLPQLEPLVEHGEDASAWPGAQPNPPDVVLEVLPEPDSPAIPAEEAPFEWIAPDESPDPSASYPPGAREGIFQKLYFTGAWLPAIASDSLGTSDLELGLTLGFPFPTRDSPLLVTPSFAAHYLDGPIAPDLPSRLYDAYLEFRWLRRVTPRVSAIVAVEPGVSSDFERDASDALRILGRGLAIYDWSPTRQLVLGVAYLDRHDVALLPAGGIIWTPSDDRRFELVVPRPKLAWRIDPPVEPYLKECWAYIGGELGGGVWSIVRADRTQDTISARDYRVFVGLERKVPGGLNRHIEIGYVFGRNIEFDSGTPDFNPHDTLLMRVGASY